MRDTPSHYPLSFCSFIKFASEVNELSLRHDLYWTDGQTDGRCGFNMRLEVPSGGIKKMEDGWTDEQAQTDFPLQLLQSWGHNNAFMYRFCRRGVGDGWTDEQAQTYLPLQLLQIWGHNIAFIDTCCKLCP